MNTNRNSSPGENTETHPAYGTIGVVRRTGTQHLFGSDAVHNTSLAITIRRAEIERRNAGDSVFSRDQLIEVVVSPAQWAEFVSSIGIGDGVPCTLKFIQGEGRVEELPKPKPQHAKFRRDMHESLDEAYKMIGSLQTRVQQARQSPSPRKSDLSAIEHDLAMLKQQLQSNMPFVAERFEEQMEEQVSRAKIEIEAHFVNRALAFGYEAAAATANALPLRPVDFEDAALAAGDEP